MGKFIGAYVVFLSMSLISYAGGWYHIESAGPGVIYGVVLVIAIVVFVPMEDRDG